MKGRIVLITGGTSGIGEAAARDLAGMGATILIVGRNPRKCTATVRRIRRQSSNRAVEALVCDLESQKEIRRLAESVKSRYGPIDVLINNAGAMFSRRDVTIDGYERTFALNHLAYFLLTMLLLDRVLASQSGRIINVSSHAHEPVQMDFENLQGEKNYDRLLAYRLSKLANLLFTYELARRIQGRTVTVNALTPGNVITNLGSDKGWLRTRVRNVWQRFGGEMLSPQEGARTIVYLASSPEVQGVSGKYFRNQVAVASNAASYDADSAARLWTISEQMAGLAMSRG